VDAPSIESSPTVKTTCPYCGVGCGVLATTEGKGKVTIKGDPDHPANFGRLCSKGTALAETLDLDGRLLHPEVGNRRVFWDAALDTVAQTFNETIARYGRESVAFYVSGQLLTEDYYVANKLMKGFIGSANIDTNSRLCMASTVAGHMRAFGSDTVPGTYEDLEIADLVVLVGSNLAWCHPVLFQRLMAAREAKPDMRIVVIDPRRTVTADAADLYLAINSDGDGALFAGLMKWLSVRGGLNESYIEKYTEGFSTLETDGAVDLEQVSVETGLSVHEIESFYGLFSNTEKTVTVFSQGVNQSACGTDKVNAIVNCHLATGRIGKPGQGPFSVTGQPNAMGGREVGGLATMLAAHMSLTNQTHQKIVQQFWQSPFIAQKPGLKAVDMFDAVADGRIKALWIMATNPVDSMPDADRVQEAIKTCPFVVVSDVMAETDTVRHAQVKLPAAAWGEKDGTVTNSERRISRQRRFLSLPGGVRPDWWIITEVARRMGFETAFAYESAADIFAEHAQLSGLANNGTRDFDISGLSELTREDYDALSPTQWPMQRGASPQERRFFGEGGYFTESGRAKFVKTEAPTHQADNGDFILNTGRIRDQWHTMTRTGKSAKLSTHLSEPFVEIHPVDADRLDIDDADLVEVGSGDAPIIARALVSPRTMRGTLFMPMHWTDQFASAARADSLVPSRRDPLSGQPALKCARVSLKKFPAKTYGYAITRQKPDDLHSAYWAQSKIPGGWQVELAWDRQQENWETEARKLLSLPPDTELLTYLDRLTGSVRYAAFEGDRLFALFCAGKAPVSVSRSWAAGLLNERFENPSQRFQVLAGRAGADTPDKGAVICSCHGVGVNQITEAIVRKRCLSVDAIGGATGAGTNCGSCRAELRTLLEGSHLEAAE